MVIDALQLYWRMIAPGALGAKPNQKFWEVIILDDSQKGGT
jgi:hypothetical protein